jgi:hypothetical protein
MLNQVLVGDQVMKDEMGRACSMHRRDEKCIQNFGQKTCRKETTLKT